MHRLFQEIKSGLVPFNAEESPDPELSIRAKQKCIDIAHIIDMGTGDISADLFFENPKRLLAAAEVVISTYYRHCRFLGEKCDDVRQVFGSQFSRSLEKASGLANHPPRGSHWNMWIDTLHDEPVMYTGHPDERLFGLLVHDTNTVMRQLSDYGIAIIIGQASFRDPSVRARLEELADDLNRVHKAYFRFANHQSSPVPDYGERWFLHFRQFLAPIEINRRVVRGPNPAHVASWPEADILFGLSNPHYVESVKGRYCSYLGHEIFRLERAMAVPPVPVVLDEVIRNEVADKAEQDQIVHLFYMLVGRLTAISGMHWSSIVKHLKKPQKKLAQEQDTTKLLSAESGVSGRDLRETEQLLADRRSSNPANAFLAQYNHRRHQSA